VRCWRHHSGANRDVIFAATLDELERTKTLVVFEDLHWADEATLDLLKYLGRRIRSTRTMLAVTIETKKLVRGIRCGIVIGELSRASTHRMTLAPLSAPAVAQAGQTSG